MNDFSRDQAVDALMTIPATVPHDIRTKVGMAARAAGVARDEYDTWQLQNPRYNKPEVTAMWDSYGDGAVGTGTLFFVAREHGWRPDRTDRPQQPQKPVKTAPEKQVRPNPSSEVWSRLEPVTTHGYATKKKLSPDTLKLCRVVPKNDPLIHRRGWLAIPGFDIAGNIQTIEFVDPNAKHGDPKPALKDSKKSGSMFAIGQDKGNIFVCEGLATADAVYQATGELAVSTFGSSNTRNVVAALRIKHPEKRIVICPDAGKESDAKKIADEFHCAVAAMPDGWAPNSDLNDLFCAADGGYDEVQNILYAAVEPTEPVEPPVDYPLTISWADELGSSYVAPDELVEGLLTTGDGSVLYGESNSGKTFLALDIACSVARGVPWQGRRVEKGVVLYLACESVSSVKGRLQAYQQHHNCRVPGFCIVENPIDLFADTCDTGRVISLVKQIEHQTNQKVRLIVGDTLARLSAGANENAGQDMGLVVQRFDKIRTETISHFLLIHHCGKNAAAGARGWSGIRAAVDSELEITDSPGGRCIEITKQRDLNTKGQRIGFKLESIVLGTSKWGEPATSCVVVDGDAPAKAGKTLKLGETQQAVMALLRGAGKNLKIKEIAELLAEQGVTRTSVYNAVNRLRDVELVEVSGGVVHLIGGKS